MTGQRTKSRAALPPRRMRLDCGYGRLASSWLVSNWRKYRVNRDMYFFWGRQVLKPVSPGLVSDPCPQLLTHLLK